jgi:transcriptional regulator with XRE-family HTH domain
MDECSRVGLNLQDLRRQRGLSQEELAHSADVSPTYVGGVERGVRNPSVKILARLARALEADIEDLTKRRLKR